MNKKGFTLVELLAVIMVIALIAAFALPQVLTQFTNYSEGLSEKQKEMILEAGRAYVEENSATYSKTENSCIPLQRLVDTEYLNADFVKDALGDNYNNVNSIKVTYRNSRFEVDLKAGSC